MAKKKIPVYDICTLTDNASLQNEFLIERFSAYLAKHYHHLHNPHRHSFYHLVFFTRGSGEHSIDFMQFRVKPQQMYCMVPGQVHSWHFKEGVDGYIINFSSGFFKPFLLNPSYLERFDFFGGIAEDSVLQLPGEVAPKVAGIMEELLEAKLTTGEQGIDNIRVLLLQLFMHVQQVQSDGRRKKLPQQKYMLIRHFQQLIEKYYKAMKLPREYADLLYITPNHLNALCQDQLGKSAGEIIRNRILLEGKRLLTNADMSISEIAYDLNFHDNSYFTRFFKRYAGITPEDFRKQFINKQI